MTTPLVSVLMPTLNSERTIEMSLAALRRQTLGRDAVEILVADGGSKDRTREIARSHGAIILENPRVLPEYGLNVALSHARGTFGLMLGSDEVLTNPESLAIKVRLMNENPLVHNVIFGGFLVPQGYPAISHYVNRFGDPFSYFMHRLDAADIWNEMPRLFELVRDEPDYRVFRLRENDVMPICDDGHFFRFEYLRKIADPSDLSIIPRLLNLMAKEHRLLAVVKDDFMTHYSTADYQTAKRKIEWRIVGNIHHTDSGSVGYASREELQPRAFRWKKYLFIPYSLSIAGPAIDAARLTARYRNLAMLYHLPLAAFAGISIVKHRALKALGVKVEHKVYGNRVRIQVVSWRDPLNPKAGGAEVCVYEIGKRLVARFGHELAWFAPDVPSKRRSDSVDGIAIERRGRFALVHLHVLERFSRRRDQTANLYLEDYHGITLGLGWFLKKPHVVLVHEVAGPIWLEMWRFPISWVGYGLEKISLRLLSRTHFIAVSESTRADLVAHGIPGDNISVITEGADIPRAREPRPRAERKSQFAFVGRVCKMKRVDLLVTAFAEHLATHPSSRLVLAGSVDEDFRAELESLMRRLGVEGQVDVLGRISQDAKSELYRGSIALVSCSMREGFGLVVVEANSQGTPALTFRVNGYRDLIEEGINGFMVAFPDVNAMADQMNALVAMPPSRYEALGVSSLERSKRYSWDDTAAHVNGILERLVEESRRP